MKNHNSRKAGTAKKLLLEFRNIYICDTPIKRLRGIFFRSNFSISDAVYLHKCSSVHGFGLSQSLDIVFLDSKNCVLAVEKLRPFSVCRFSGATNILELACGQADRLGISVEDQIRFNEEQSDIKKQSRSYSSSVTKAEGGASTVEFIIVAPVLCFLGFGLIQLGFAYHARNILDYATFEAARVGAVNQADTHEMRKELAYRLAPIFGGDGSDGMLTSAVRKSVVAVSDPIRTKIDVINPTSAAFDDFGEIDSTTGEQILPNEHLQYRSNEIGSQSGVSLQEANILKIEITHGYELRLPWLDVRLPGVSLVLRELMTRANPENAIYYARGQIPLRSVATVRMQSNALRNNVEAPESGISRPETPIGDDVPELGEAQNSEGIESSSDPIIEHECVGAHGLPIGLEIESITGDVGLDQCSVQIDFTSESSIEGDGTDDEHTFSTMRAEEAC